VYAVYPAAPRERTVSSYLNYAKKPGRFGAGFGASTAGGATAAGTCGGAAGPGA
jgi:hypothetical protein